MRVPDRDQGRIARLRQRRWPPPLILGQDSKNSRMQENTVAVRILRIGQQISPPPFLRSGYDPGDHQIRQQHRETAASLHE